MSLNKLNLTLERTCSHKIPKEMGHGIGTKILQEGFIAASSSIDYKEENAEETNTLH